MNVMPIQVFQGKKWVTVCCPPLDEYCISRITPELQRPKQEQEQEQEQEIEVDPAELEKLLNALKEKIS